MLEASHESSDGAVEVIVIPPLSLSPFRIDWTHQKCRRRQQHLREAAQALGRVLETPEDVTHVLDRFLCVSPQPRS